MKHDFLAQTPQEILSFRGYNTFNYLKTHSNYWNRVVDKAHALLDKYESAGALVKGYPQADFELDLMYGIDADIESADIDSVYQAQGGDCATLVAKLKTQGRGAVGVIYLSSGSDSPWRAFISAGGGFVRDVSHMDSNLNLGVFTPGQHQLLKLEAFEARRQAMVEREILANYAKIRDFNLKPGIHLVGVPVSFHGNKVFSDFTIKSITPNGWVHLTDGRLNHEPYSTIVKAIELDFMAVELIA